MSHMAYHNSGLFHIWLTIRQWFMCHIWLTIRQWFMAHMAYRKAVVYFTYGLP